MAYPKLTPIIATGATEPRYINDRFADVVNPFDFGAKGDGTTDDSDAFEALESNVTGRFINLCGKSYVVDSIPTSNIYYNGKFIVNNVEKTVENCLIYERSGDISGVGVVNYCTVIAGEKPSGFNDEKHEAIVRLGTGSLKSLDSTKGVTGLVALGEGVMSEGHPGNFNIGVGTFALHNVDGVGSTKGDRNTAVGSLALFGLTEGRCNTCLGRDTGQSITTGSNNVCLGYRALSGFAPMSISGKIENQNSLAGSDNICIGNSSGFSLSGNSSENIVIGASALRNKKTAENNVVIGTYALRDAGAKESFNQKNIISSNIIGTYTQTGYTITVTAQNHSAVAGCLVYIYFTSGTLYDDYTWTDGVYLTVDSVVDSNTFTIVSPTSLTASGACTITEFEQSTSYNGGVVSHSVVVGGIAANLCPSVNSGVIIGFSACRYSDKKVNYSVAIGQYAAAAKNLDQSVVIGDNAAGDVEKFRDINYSVIIGKNAAYSLEQSSSATNACTVVGRNAGYGCKNLDQCVFVGMSAGNITDGELSNCTAVGHTAMYSTTAATISKSTAIGAGSSVTGSNQIQLGSSTETTYAYGSVQDRSDERDKTEIRDTVLGLDFICSLRPVDFKWDYRDAYVDYIEHKVDRVDENGETITEVVVDAVRVEKDGSRKRNRFHHGLIAQEVKAVLDAKGIDFGGYQDHKINGGEDVLTLGYEEFIAPIIKSLQEIDSRLKALEA